jgi:hypothetical protein
MADCPWRQSRRFGHFRVRFSRNGSSVDLKSAPRPVNGYGAFNDYYETTYLSNYSATVVSMIGSIQLFMLYICA